MVLEWRSTTWARWLGWTVLFGLTWFGATVVADRFDRDEPWPHLVGLALALLIGVRFRSWWWVLGPLIALSLPFSVLLIASGWPVLLPLVVAYAGLFALAAAAGVWIGNSWGERQQSL